MASICLQMVGFIWKSLNNAIDQRNAARTLESWRELLPPETMQKIDAISAIAPTNSNTSTAASVPVSGINRSQAAVHMLSPANAQVDIHSNFRMELH
jgi:hypothetical protein